jgi:hypothetical protein
MNATAIAAFDHCDRLRHYVACSTNGAFVACPDGFVWHHCWDPYTRYHDVDECPNASETVDGAWQACEP